MFLQTNEVRKMAIVNGLQLASIFPVWCAPKSAACKVDACKAPPEWGVRSVAKQSAAGGQPIGTQTSSGFAPAQPCRRQP
ncbi:hypothetical protein JKG47_20660, partial [Acidithiobacillus sp. MC6.1]|nr:hypothetical protein [Acidithiobacillus sp. MC6.1]